MLMQRLIVLSIFLLLVIAAAAFGGQFIGGEWYQTMYQPAWQPAAWMMATAWAVVYVLMAVSAWMVWDTLRGLAQAAHTWWFAQLILSVLWCWVFFGLHRMGWAIAVMFFWFVITLIVTKAFRSIRPEAARLMVPVIIWLLFVLLLNFTQWRVNGGGLATIIS